MGALSGKKGTQSNTLCSGFIQNPYFGVLAIFSTGTYAWEKYAKKYYLGHRNHNHYCQNYKIQLPLTHCLRQFLLHKSHKYNQGNQRYTYQMFGQNRQREKYMASHHFSQCLRLCKFQFLYFLLSWLKQNGCILKKSNFLNNNGFLLTIGKYIDQKKIIRNYCYLTCFSTSNNYIIWWIIKAILIYGWFSSMFSSPQSVIQAYINQIVFCKFVTTNTFNCQNTLAYIDGCRGKCN